MWPEEPRKSSEASCRRRRGAEEVAFESPGKVVLHVAELEVPPDLTGESPCFLGRQLGRMGEGLCACLVWGIWA